MGQEPIETTLVTAGPLRTHSYPAAVDGRLARCGVLSGRLTIQLRDRDVELSAGELYVVPRGVEHCPKADEQAEVLLIEPEGTVNTGDAGGEHTEPERRI